MLWKLVKGLVIAGFVIGGFGYFIGTDDTASATHTVVGAGSWGTGVGIGAIRDEAPAAFKGGLNAGSGKPMFGPEPDVEGEAQKAMDAERAKIRAEEKAKAEKAAKKKADQDAKDDDTKSNNGPN